MRDCQKELPFIDELRFGEGKQSLKAFCRLELARHRFLQDHVFINATDVKAPSACLPVVPFSIALEIAVESAAPLAASCGFIGVYNAVATRWIELLDVNALDLEIDSQIVKTHFPHVNVAVESVVRDKLQGIVYFSAVILFGEEYQETVHFSPIRKIELEPVCTNPVTLYKSKILIHGPSFQCLDGGIKVSENFVQGPARSFHPESFLRDSSASLYTDPLIIDCISQLVFSWSIARGLSALPISIEHLEVYSPLPPPETLVDLSLEIQQLADRTVVGNIEASLKGTKQVWFRCRAFKYWAFHWSLKYHRFRCAPTRHCLSERVRRPNEDDTSFIMSLSSECLRDAVFDHLARGCLTTSEMEYYDSLEVGKEDWLTLVILVKDLYRNWEMIHSNAPEMTHPAALDLQKLLGEGAASMVQDCHKGVRLPLTPIPAVVLEIIRQEENVIGLIRPLEGPQEDLTSLIKNKLELEPKLVQDYMTI